MKPLKVTTLPLILVALTGTLLLQGCNTTAGIGRDVSAGGHAVTGAAERGKAN